MKKLIDLVFPAKQIKYTCSCCGYKTLLSNGMGELCPVCFWEEGYDDDPDNLFSISSANRITLYQAQDNYKKYGCYKQEIFPRCRKPNENEVEDINWLSIQEQIEKKYDQEKSFAQIVKLSELLKQNYADTAFTNFKRLQEIDITRNYEDIELDHIEFGEAIIDSSNQLFLKSLLINISKINLNLLTQLLNEYYKKGMCYYITWSIMIFVLVEFTQDKLGDKTTDIFLDIENNNYYGLGSLEATLTNYWHIT